MSRRFPVDDMHPAEHLRIWFLFARELDPGETLVSPVVLTPRLIEGADATPSLFIDSAPVVLPDQVIVRVAGRIAGNTYELQCDAPTSTGNVRTAIAVQRVRDD